MFRCASGSRVSTSPKGRLALAAVREFGGRRFDEVTVGELASAADVTTGAIYHHFGSKLGLYVFVREDVERRVLDRMEGALAASARAVGSLRGRDRPRCWSGSTSPSARASSASWETRPAGAERDRLAEMLTRQHGPGVPGSRPACSRQPGGRRWPQSPKVLSRSRPALRSWRSSSGSRRDR